MESLLDKALSYLVHHLQDLANYGTTVSAVATLILVILTNRQLRGGKLNREVALAQLEVTKRQEITAWEQGVAARGQQRASYEAVDQQKRSARIAEEMKLDNPRWLMSAGTSLTGRAAWRAGWTLRSTSRLPPISQPPTVATNG